MHKHALRIFGGILVAALCGTSARADDKDKVNPALNPNDCDISFTSKIKAKTLRVDVVGHPKVTFHGSSNRQVLFDVKRAGFPKPVQPGKTYNNIQVDTKILTKFTEPQKGNNNASDADTTVLPAGDAGARSSSGTASGSSGSDNGSGSGQANGEQNVQPEHRQQSDQ